MKRPLIICLVITLSLSVLSAKGEVITDPTQLSPNAALIDFENFDTGGNMITLLPNPVTFGGMTFTSLTGSLLIFDISLSPNWSINGNEVAAKTLAPGNSEPDSAISITFTYPVAEFLLGWGDPNFSGNVLRAYDANGNLLEEAAVALGPPGGVHAAWIGFKRPTPDIAMVMVQPDQSYPNGDDYVIDNIYYSTAAPDEDYDGVPDSEDLCPGTAIPEAVPTERLGVNRFALVDGDSIFDTTPPKGKGPRTAFTITDTAGCSCSQIIDALGLGEGHRKFGCSGGVMSEWIKMVHP